MAKVVFPGRQTPLATLQNVNRTRTRRDPAKPIAALASDIFLLFPSPAQEGLLHSRAMVPPSNDLDGPSRPARVASRWGLSFTLSILMLGIYAGFILLVAFNKPLLGQVIVPGLSWGILLGALVIVSAWVLTLIYVLWANRNLNG
jgi:uncharacterized membrane protein (DUF485 family)